MILYDNRQFLFPSMKKTVFYIIISGSPFVNLCDFICLQSFGYGSLTKTGSSCLVQGIEGKERAKAGRRPFPWPPAYLLISLFPLFPQVREKGKEHIPLSPISVSSAS
jgi:hypothetical protein